MLLHLFGIVILLICIYTIRHYCFTLNRVMGEQRHPYIDIDTAEWPAVTVLIAAHNEEAVVADILRALLEVDYPQDKLVIVPVNDRSQDRTREIIDSFVELHPDRIIPFHRTEGKPGKAAALKDAIKLPNGIRMVTPEWLVILKFNAGRQKDLDDIVFLLKQPKLVDRPTVKQKVVDTAGEDVWLMMLAGFRRLCDLADSKTTEPSKYYDQDERQGK